MTDETDGSVVLAELYVALFSLDGSTVHSGKERKKK